MQKFFSKYSNKFYCFSPTVMLATFLFESIAALLVITKYRKSPKRTLIITLLFALAGFQIAEFMVCGGFGIKGVEWARFGYVSITLLPPLGYHLAHLIAGKKVGFSVKFAYATMIGFIAYYLLVTNGVQADSCRPNYSVFNVPQIAGWLYALYYYGWLFVAIFFCWQEIKKLSDKESRKIVRIVLSKLRFLEKIVPNESIIKIKALKWLLVGYLVFVVPTTFVNIINPNTIEGIPSIMCGFAVLLAVILLLKVSPLVLTRKK